MERLTRPSLLLAALFLCGCTMTVTNDTIMHNNASIAAAHTALPNFPTAEGHYASGTSVVTDDLKASFGRLHTVMLQSDVKKPLIVFCGGNLFREESVGAKFAETLSAFGDVLIYDYPGFGSSDGTSTRAEFAETETLILAKVQTLMAGRSGPLIFWGHSLGGGICSSLAAHSPLKSALVLATTFARYDDFKTEVAGIFGHLVTLKVPDTVIRYEAPELLRDYNGPIFAITLTEDETVAFAIQHKLVLELGREGKGVTVITLSGKGHSRVHSHPEFHDAMKRAFKSRGIDTGE